MILVKIISELNSNHYNRTDVMSDELRFGIIKYNKWKILLLFLIVIEQ